MNVEKIDSLAWEKSGGLLPAIVQDAKTSAVLMLGYMNHEALQRTLTEGRVTFFSRTRQSLWTKGETSGHFLDVVSVTPDCDADTLLVLARPHGPVCHNGTPTCFPGADAAATPRLSFLAALEGILSERMAHPPEGSYTAALLQKGRGRIAQKVGEEGVELALAAVSQGDAEVVSEAADLVFHVLLLLRERGLRLADVVAELEARHADRTTRESRT